MKILFLLTTSLDSPYGRSRCLPIARELSCLGHQITILALHHDLSSCSSRHYTIQTDGVPIDVHYVGQMHVLKRGMKKIYFRPWKLIVVLASALWGFLSKGLRVPADAVQVGKAQPINGFAGWLISRLRHLPLFLDCDDYEAKANRFSGVLQQRIVAFCEDWLPGRVQGITVNTRFLLNRCRLLGASEQNTVLVPNGVHWADGQESPWDDDAMQDAKASGPTRPIVAYIGTLSLESHPVDLLIEAFGRVVQENPAAHLLIVGGGADEEGLRRVATEKPFGASIHFTGPVSYEDAQRYYRAAMLTVDPVRDDEVAAARCPLKLMESLRAGRPIVTGDVGDRKELLGCFAEEWIVQPDSAEALAEGIIRVIELQTTGRWPVSMIRLRASEFDWRELARRWSSIYRGHSPRMAE